MDMFDSPVLAYTLVCDGNLPLTNAFVLARKPHTCCLCSGPINSRDRVRRETRRSADGSTIETRHVCPGCCRAIADAVPTEIEKNGARFRFVDPAIGRKGDGPSGTFARPSAASGEAASSEGQSR